MLLDAVFFIHLFIMNCIFLCFKNTTLLYVSLLMNIVLLDWYDVDNSWWMNSRGQPTSQMYFFMFWYLIILSLQYHVFQTLSSYIWKLKDREIPRVVNWSIKARGHPSSSGGRSCSCNLCLTEKLVILMANQNSMLNKRDELLEACRHRRKHLLVS